MRICLMMRNWIMVVCFSMGTGSFFWVLRTVIDHHDTISRFPRGTNPVQQFIHHLTVIIQGVVKHVEQYPDTGLVANLQAV